MVLFPFHWTTKFKCLLVAHPCSELLLCFSHFRGALLGLGKRGAALHARKPWKKALHVFCQATYEANTLMQSLSVLLMDNSTFEKKYETSADNICLQCTVTTIGVNTTQPLTAIITYSQVD